MTSKSKLSTYRWAMTGKDHQSLTGGLGDGWLNSKRTALARVPSAILPNTWNVLLNPEHLAAGQIRIIETTKTEYDLRLFPKLGVL